jgi:hypothetical protein
MDFETRLEAMRRSSSFTNVEIDAAVNTYDRLVTAKSMCKSVFGEASPEVVAAVLSELAREGWLMFANEEKLKNEGVTSEQDADS